MYDRRNVFRGGLKNNYMEYLNIILLIFQILILIVQVGYERYANQITIKQKRAIFKICVNNIRQDQFSTNQPRHYDLLKEIAFKNIGDDYGTLLESKIIVNDNITYHVQTRCTFASNEEHDGFIVHLNLNENDSIQSYLVVKMYLKLKNTMNYCYIQIIDMEFKLDKMNKIWTLEKYNWELQDESFREFAKDCVHKLVSKIKNHSI